MVLFTKALEGNARAAQQLYRERFHREMYSNSSVDFFVWRALKAAVCATPIESEMDLVAIIADVAALFKKILGYLRAPTA
ncbi:hypothetical protein CEXT_65771 [Caerostris extrusa]|uniref:Uncharacterized protein n=1 Tax=Caerostris extrusa TaxID=172846 RepID=A0AAV4VXR9_CAEEX|nr:hypothetical protein CEXT_65771 [Caerostris extrusa]